MKKYHFYSHFINDETEVKMFSNLPKNTHVVLIDKTQAGLGLSLNL
jgi:hypothetical protein